MRNWSLSSPGGSPISPGGSLMVKYDDEASRRFTELCKECGIPSDLETELVARGWDQPKLIARLHGSVEFRSGYLGIEVSPDGGSSARSLTDDEQQKLRRLYNLCRAEARLPERRNTQLTFPKKKAYPERPTSK